MHVYRGESAHGSPPVPPGDSKTMRKRGGLDPSAPCGRERRKRAADLGAYGPHSKNEIPPISYFSRVRIDRDWKGQEALAVESARTGGRGHGTGNALFSAMTLGPLTNFGFGLCGAFSTGQLNYANPPMTNRPSGACALGLHRAAGIGSARQNKSGAVLAC